MGRKRQETRAASLASQFLNDMNHGVTLWVHFVGFEVGDPNDDAMRTLAYLKRRNSRTSPGCASLFSEAHPGARASALETAVMHKGEIIVLNVGPLELVTLQSEKAQNLFRHAPER